MTKFSLKKMIKMLYLLTLSTTIFVESNVYASSNSDQNSPANRNTQEITNNNDNNNIIYNILNSNIENRRIDITGNATISLFENNSQQFGNYPIYRISHNERREGSNENIEYFVMRENTQLNFRDGTFRFELGSNRVEVSNFELTSISATVNLVVAINSEGIIGGLRGVGNRPKLGIEYGGMLNIELDENTIDNMETDRPYPVISGFNILNRDRIRFNNNNRRIISYSLNNDYYISLNSNNIDTNNIRYNIENLNNNRSIYIGDSVTISLFENNPQIFTPTLSLIRSNHQRLNDYSFFRILHNEETRNNDENVLVIDGFLATESLGINFIGQRITETRIVVQDNITIPNNINSFIYFENGIFRFELGSNRIEVERIRIYNSATLNLVVAINSEGIIGGLRGVGNRPELGIEYGSMLNIELDENTVDNMEPNRVYPVISRFDIPGEYRDRIRFNNNNRRLIGYFEDNGDYFVLNSGLTFTGWQLRQLSSMSAQLQFTSNSNPEASDLFDSGGRYSMYYVNENTEILNNEHEGLDFMSDLDPEIRNYWLGLIETFHNMDEYERNGVDEDTTVVLRAIEEIIRRENRGNRGNMESYTNNRLSSSDEENEYSNTILNNIRDNPNNNFYTHFDNLVTVEEEEENNEETDIIPSPALDIIPTPDNNSLPNNMRIGGTSGGGSGF